MRLGQGGCGKLENTACRTSPLSFILVYMDSLTVSPSLLVPNVDTRLTPAMVTALWVIGDAVDRKRLKTTPEDGLWLEIPSARLRGEEGRNDNVWLRQCLDRLMGMKINGQYRGDPWGAVVISEWRIEQGGTLTKILVPPSAVTALRAPETFAKIETFAAYKLQGAARRLYAALADKKRLDQQHWTFGVEELRNILGVANKKSYQRWNNFRQWVLDPALESVNDFGTVKVTMQPQKIGRAISTVRFDWNWKTVDEARETDEENERPSSARHKSGGDGLAPPLTDEEVRRQNAEQDRAAFKEWQNGEGRGGTYSDYLSWKKQDKNGEKTT